MGRPIAKLVSVKNFGFLDAYSWPSGGALGTFNELNLVYGFNGSGKTSLSRLLAVLESGFLPTDPDYASADFKIELGTSPVEFITQSRLSRAPRMRVFNQDFIEEHIKLKQGSADAIYHLIKLNPSDKARLDKLEADEAALENKLKTAQDRKAGKIAERDKLLSDVAKTVKASISLHSPYYLSYNSTKLAARLEPLISGTELPATLRAQELGAYQLTAVAQEPSNSITLFFKRDMESLGDDIVVSTELLQRQVIADFIALYREHPDINAWAKEGYVLHKKHDSKQCLYCGQPLSGDRLRKLGEHFNAAYTQLQADIRSHRSNVEACYRVEPPQLRKEQFDKALQEAAETRLISYNDAVKKWNDFVDELLALLDQKVNAPAETLTLSVDLSAANTELASAAKELDGLIAKHNSLIASFASSRKTAAETVELHYASDCLPRMKTLGKGVKDLSLEVDRYTEQLKPIQQEMATLKSKASGDGAAAVEINRIVTSLLGRSDIKLIANGGAAFEIQRNGKKTNSLSEGEQTAVAFAYYCSSLLSDGKSKLKDAILVIDDPISSLDHHRLFAVSSQVKLLCDAAGQTIIMTHNYDFFRELRKWLNKKNSSRVEEGKQPVANLYFIESVCDTSSKRCMLLQALPKLLKDYDSDYHFNFEQLYQFSLRGDANRAYYMPNITRKVLETFLAFKAPGSTELSALDIVCGDRAKRDRINRFLNFTNHADYIDRITTLDHNVISGAQDVAKDVLSVIEVADKLHYDALIKKCTANP